MFGVGDNGDSIGFADPQKVCLDIENKINDSISPKPDFNLSVNDDNIKGKPIGEATRLL